MGVNEDSSDTEGHICNSWSSCDVTGGNGSIDIGGLAGGSGGPRCIITNCYSTGTVRGYTSSGVGGLVGGNNSIISKCFSTSPVIGEGSSWDIGGLVGGNDYDINNCYATGAVTGGLGSDYIGGLVGSNGGPDISSINDCYSVGVVTSGATHIGGLIGVVYLGTTINSSYFLNTSGPNNGSGTPLTDSQMKQQSSFVGWDFVGETINGTEDIWWMLEGVTYPKFAWYWYDSNEPNGGGPNNGAAADFDQNGIINFLDFAVLAAAWQTENPYISLDADTDVDIYDLKIFCNYWLKEP